MRVLVTRSFAVRLSTLVLLLTLSAPLPLPARGLSADATRVIALVVSVEFYRERERKLADVTIADQPVSQNGRAVNGL